MLLEFSANLFLMLLCDMGVNMVVPGHNATCLECELIIRVVNPDPEKRHSFVSN